MKTTQILINEFLNLKKIAVVGVSDKRDSGCNANYNKFKEQGYTVFAVNPRISSYNGDVCYPNLKSIPEKPEGVFILARPSVTEQIVAECIDLGVKHVWMHCMMGTKPGIASGITSVSQTAVELCRANNINVIPGTCPAQFLKPDPAHRFMKFLWKTIGFLR